VIELFGIGRTADHQAHGVEQHAFGGVVGHKFGILLEDFAVGWIVDVFFQGHLAALAHHRKHFEKHGKQFHIIGVRVAVTDNGVLDAVDHRFDGFNGRADDQGAQRCAADDQQFDRLDQDRHGPAFDHESAEHGTENDYITDDGKHRPAIPLSPQGGVCLQIPCSSNRQNSRYL
jgi:hypothetical protein